MLENLKIIHGSNNYERGKLKILKNSMCGRFYIDCLVSSWTASWPRITDEGSVSEMRIWSILLIKSDFKWCIHLSRSLFSYCNGPWVLHPYQVSSKSIKQFWRSWNANNLRTDDKRTDDIRHAMTIAQSSIRLRWAKMTNQPENLIKVLLLFGSIFSHILMSHNQTCWCTGFCHRTESDFFLFLFFS